MTDFTIEQQFFKLDNDFFIELGPTAEKDRKGWKLGDF